MRVCKTGRALSLDAPDGDIDAGSQRELAQAEQRAHDYWSGDLGADPRIEVVAEGEVEVIHTLEATE